METSLYSICFPDIFGLITSYLSDCELVNLARTNSRLAKFIKDTGLLYRHISFSFKPPRRNKASSDEAVRNLLPSLQAHPENASMVRSLTIRHQFSGCVQHEELVYADHLSKICQLCPNLTSLSLHLSNFATTYWLAEPNNDYRKPPEGASRAFFCQALGHDFEANPAGSRVIDQLLAHLPHLRYLEWCIETRPSGILSEDWKASRLREELEIINYECPRLEHLGLLNFCDCHVSDAILHEIDSEGTENFLLERENAISGLFPHLKDVTFYIAKERDQEKILSAVTLGMILTSSRRIACKVAPWCQENASRAVILENISDLMKIQELMEKQMDVSLEQFVNVWGNYVDAKIAFEIAYSSNDTLQLELLHLISRQSKSVNIALNAKGISPSQLSTLILPGNTRQFSISSDSVPLNIIAHMIAPLRVSSLTVDFQDTFHDETDEKVMMVLERNRSTDKFTAEWASEPIMSFNMAIWGDIVPWDYGQNLFEAVVGRAIGRTTWESRKNLESITRGLFERSTCLKKVEISATYPLYREELASPRLFKL